MSKHGAFKHITVYDVPEKSPGFLLWHMSTTWRNSIEAVLKSFYLTHPQFVVLATLGWLTRNGERISQAALGNMAGLDPNTTSQIIRSLELKKLIKRVQSSDNRVKNPLLTTKGFQTLAKALPAVELADAQFFKVLSEQEKDGMIKIFQKLI
jgi:DNA-binding MarR family transcriptional regulator